MRALLAPMLLLGMLGGLACDEGDVRLGPRPVGPGGRDASTFGETDELLRLLPGTHAQAKRRAVQARDVRPLLPRRPMAARVGDRVFAVVPVGQRWQSVGWRSARVLSVASEGVATVSLEEGREVRGVPAALMVPHSRQRPQVGEVVRAGIGRGLPYARVTRLEGDGVVVRTVFLGEVREATLVAGEVMRLPTQLELGAPVVFRLPTGQRIGSVIAAAPESWWVLGPEGAIHHLASTKVAALVLNRTFGPGDLVRAALPMNLRAATITKVLDPGLRYEVGWEQTRREVVCFSTVAPR